MNIKMKIFSLKTVARFFSLSHTDNQKPTCQWFFSFIPFSRAEPQLTVKMCKYNVFCWFSNLIIMLNKNGYHSQSKSLSSISGMGAFYTSSSYVSLDGKKCHILLLPEHIMVHIGRNNART